MKHFVLLTGIVLISVVLFAQKNKTIEHTVQAKETLYSISRKYNIPVADIAAVNGFDKNKSLSLGQKVLIPVSKDGQQQSQAAVKSKKENTTSNTVQMAAIVGSNINIRKGPATDQPVIATGQQNDVVTVLRKIDNDWTWIRTKDGLEGYIASQFLQPAEKTIAKTTPVSVVKELAVKKATIAGTNINIRKGPARNEEVVGTLQQNDVVDIIKVVDKEWVAIRTKDGLDGFIASQFLQSGETKIKPAPSTKANPQETIKAKVNGNNINIRKGPSTNQPVTAIAQQDEIVTVIKKVNDEWTEILADGGQGYIASRFLLPYDGKVDENAAVKTNEENKKAEDIVTEKITARQNTEAITAAIKETGYFTQDYEKQTNPSLVSEKLVISGIFKSDRGWNDGKYYLLMDQVAAGTIIKITNPNNNKFVYAKVLGKMKGLQYSEGFDVRISDAAVAKLQLGDDEKFNLSVTY